MQRNYPSQRTLIQSIKRFTRTHSGSGFVISEDGLVVTNAHVVASSIGEDNPVMITLTDGRRFSGKVREMEKGKGKREKGATVWGSHLTSQ